MGGAEHATPAQLTVMMLSCPLPSRVLTNNTGRGKNHGRGESDFLSMASEEKRGWKRITRPAGETNRRDERLPAHGSCVGSNGRDEFTKRWRAGSGRRGPRG